MPSPKAVLANVRARWPFFDHLARAYGRYQEDAGDRLAAAVTFYWFLSLFPLLLLAVSVLGYALGDRADEEVAAALSGFLPGSLIETISTTLNEAKGPAGVLGLVGLLFSGLGWVDGLRQALRVMWHQSVLAGNFVKRKLTDVTVLVGLFATVAASVVFTVVVTGFTGWVLGLIGIGERSIVATVLTASLGYTLAIVADTVLFLYLFIRLARVAVPARRVLRGAVFGAVGFELLKIAGGFYVERTTSRGEATYGTFAVVVGLLLFLNLVSRFILFTAAYTVTAPGDSDVAPSGTASPEMARRAGIPEELATDEPSPVAPEPAAAAVLAGEAQVRKAAQVAAGVIGVGLAAVAVTGVRTVRAALRR
ncbi:MAG TPA: YihY/virulence factor BrkB family protein [Mycobacteriales bacterium]|nr:YihY/virulence factor BrkB family protein [Mycobacteriales bacterium]